VKTLHVGLGDRSYDIQIGHGLLASAGHALIPFVRAGEPVAVLTDSNVWQRFGVGFSGSLRAAGVDCTPYVLPPGEQSKCIRELEKVYDWLGSECRLTRGGLVVALGGGVVGDLAGFAAATWMRGIRFVQIPTTLLSQVDSSVGGKTGIDTPHGKNLVGAFHQPALVLIDPSVLDGLPARERAAGMAEVVKYAAIASSELFDTLSSVPLSAHEGIAGALPSGAGALEDVILSCVAIKRDIVAEDERDTGRRALLNFGHTFGHAIELRASFAEYNHGEAVAAGMRIAATLGEQIGFTVPGTEGRLRALLARYGIAQDAERRGLVPLIRSDKKAAADGVALVLLHEIGQAGARLTGFDELEELLDD
jgi:3-dehydroquinate synthase